MLQATETMVIGASAVNETRFQYFHVANGMTPNSSGAAIQVLGSFNGGAAPIGNSSDTQNTSELHNYTSLVRGHHSWRLGARLLGATDRNVSRLTLPARLPLAAAWPRSWMRTINPCSTPTDDQSK